MKIGSTPARKRVTAQTPTIASRNRLPAVKLSIKHGTEKVNRRDKVGGRSFAGLPTGTAAETEYQLRTLSDGLERCRLSSPATGHSFGPQWARRLARIRSIDRGRQLRIAAPVQRQSRLGCGQGVSVGGELRFVTAVVDEQQCRAERAT